MSSFGVGSFGAAPVWELICTGFALLAAVLVGVLTVQGKLRSPPLACLGVTGAAAGVIAFGQWSVRGWPDPDPTALRVDAMAFAVVHLIAPLCVGPVGLATLGLAAFAGAREAPRHLRPALAALVVTAAVAGVVAWGGLASANPLYATARAVAYAVAGGIAAIALLSGGEGGPVAAATAGATFPILVAVGEASERGLVYLVLSQAALKVPGEKWPDGVAQMLALVEAEWRAGLAAVGLSALVAAIGVAAARGVRGQAAVAAIVALAVAAALVGASDLGAVRALALAQP